MKLFENKKNLLDTDNTAHPLAGTSVLVIDDQEDIRTMVCAMLEKEGCQVPPASKGAIAMEMFITNTFSVVVTDMAMPEKDGVQTIIELRRLFPRVGIVAMSGYFEKEKLLRLANAFEADVILKKPFRIEELVTAVTIAKQKSHR